VQTSNNFMQIEVTVLGTLKKSC